MDGRGRHPNSQANLDKGTKINAEIARKYQDESRKSRNENTSIKKWLKIILAEKPDEDPTLPNNAAYIAVKLIQGAKNGDIQSQREVMDRTDGKPVDKTAQTDAEGNDIMQPPVINILPVEVKHDDNPNTEAVAISVEHKPTV